ncbi:MAG: stilbene synthase [Verrucomicrobia bacterium]|nr:stilbene synthase [Verrucomicrobiota bacterium]
MFITGLGIATPPRRYSQRECWEACRVSAPVRLLSTRAQTLLERVFLGANGIEGRYLALADLREVFELTPDALHSRFRKHAPALAGSAVERALQDARLPAVDVDAVIVSTCTGYLCPGLTSYVAEQMGLRPDVLALDLVGQGCGAAIPNLRVAEALLASGRARHVLAVCVEVCSASFYLDDDPGVLVSACLFGDGAAAAVLSSEQPTCRRVVRWEGAAGILNPADRDYLKFEMRDGMLRNVLTKRVPVMSGKCAEAVLRELLSRTGVRRDQITTWLLHAGGRDVLRVLRDRLELQETDLRWSVDTLRQYGNLSSASILFSLQAAWVNGAPGGHWWMTSFGAGFSCQGALLCVT